MNREYTDRLFDLIEEGIVDSKDILSSLIYWVSEEDIKKFCALHDVPVFYEELEEEDIDEDR